MEKRPSLVAAESFLATPLDEFLVQMQTAVGAADDGLRLISAFLRIRDPAVRAAAVNLVSELANSSEQASLRTPEDSLPCVCARTGRRPGEPRAWREPREGLD